MKKYLVIFEKTKTGYSAYVPDLPGCVAGASTKEETEKLIFEGIKFHLDGLKQDGLPIPGSNSEAENLIFEYV